MAFHVVDRLNRLNGKLPKLRPVIVNAPGYAALHPVLEAFAGADESFAVKDENIPLHRIP
ncbi:hypothetical protein D3C76_156410 [compost metagenome]